jgi:hypothetical protein
MPSMFTVCRTISKLEHVFGTFTGKASSKESNEPNLNAPPLWAVGGRCHGGRGEGGRSERMSWRAGEGARGQECAQKPARRGPPVSSLKAEWRQKVERRRDAGPSSLLTKLARADAVCPPPVQRAREHERIDFDLCATCSMI